MILCSHYTKKKAPCTRLCYALLIRQYADLARYAENGMHRRTAYRFRFHHIFIFDLRSGLTCCGDAFSATR